MWSALASLEPQPAQVAPARAGRSACPSLPRRVYRHVRAMLAAIGLMCLIWFPFFNLSKVVSPSMQPTLQGAGRVGGDWVVSERISYLFRSPRRWEVVRFTDEDGYEVSKRVVGLPGEAVQLINGKLLIDGREMPVPRELSFLHYYAYGPHLHNSRAAPCGDGYFVLGDDSKDSLDSRYTGPISRVQITGRAWLRVWPARRIGWVGR